MVQNLIRRSALLGSLLRSYKNARTLASSPNVDNNDKSSSTFSIFNSPRPPIMSSKEERAFIELQKTAAKENAERDEHRKQATTPQASSVSAPETGSLFKGEKNMKTGEIGGPKGLEPTRYGDWERSGRVYDF